MNGESTLFTMINQNAEKALNNCKKNKKKTLAMHFRF